MNWGCEKRERGLRSEGELRMKSEELRMKKGKVQVKAKIKARGWRLEDERQRIRNKA
jgi:hypothetical protein